MSFITSSPTSNLRVRCSHRLMGTFEPESSSPFLRILDDPLILPNSNPLIEKNSSHSSHDEDDALSISPKQVQKLSTKLDKMGNWLLQENHNQDYIQATKALKKVLHDSDQGVNLLCGITHLVHSNVKPLAQEAQDLGLFPLVTSVKPFSIPFPSVPTYTPSLVTMIVVVPLPFDFCKSS